MNDIKERPILFSAPMVRAILDGRKTMMRRIVKIQPECKSWCNCVDYPNEGDRLYWSACYGSDETPNGEETYIRCPYGSPGDRLWVRETWAECRNVVDGETEAVHKAGPWRNENEPLIKNWRPSIHMPRWASRITLQVEAVRVERLQDITGGDARSEGCDPDWEAFDYATCDKEGWDEPEEFDEECEVECDWVNYGRRLVETREHKEWESDRTNYALRLAFRKLWESINGPDSWNANPWVWVVSFTRNGGA